MLFNSFQFFIFFPVVVIVYFTLPYKWRWLFLLLASCYFYMAFVPVYVLILAVTIIVDYIAGLLIERNSGGKRTIYLALSIVTNISFLGFFKYYNFFASNIQVLSNLLHWNYSPSLLSIILPIGLSFHTFQAMSYTIEVYRGNQKAESNLGIFALYVMFFPQLVAGPIERPQNLLHQFRQKHDFDYERVVAGLRLILWGMFKKVVIADRLALVVNQVYNFPHNYQGVQLLLATFFFSFQIYCDFSGYSDIALGSAKVLGFELMVNFQRPYFSKSISEFWRRWHISLSSWFRDYLYIPLGGNRAKPARVYINLLLVFLLSGLWHGANWTFIFWGSLHGLYLVGSQLFGKIRIFFVSALKLEKIPIFLRALRTFITFCLVCLGWVLFRANNLSDAGYIFGHLGSGVFNFVGHITDYATVSRAVSLGVDFPKSELLIGALSIGVLLLVEYLSRKSRNIWDFFTPYPWLRWSVYFALALAILLFGKIGTQQFIYFQF